MLNYLPLSLTCYSFATRMSRAVLQYLLSLCILLLSVYSQLYASTSQECICHSSKRTLARYAHVSDGIANGGSSKIIKATLSGTENENCKLIAAEIEEEKHGWVSFKKYLATSNYFTTLLYGLTLSCFGLFLKKRLPSGKHALYFSSYKWYLLFRVIRI
ncbi:hypothetical protein AHMF7616_03578 [Adhaeribacter pallidiroseus]|uniref:Uncharacterized protein n=1 Tax=Adhaeribacter pallidiroseus TaxID=2072847 RepID=A0A369QNV4_9BACT|nr:hypothetical protein AHMF7616_03578 [Adhaeribacter pallidiroseus]